MTIRQYAKSKGFSIMGKLTRKTEWEQDTEFWYMDEAGNEYCKNEKGIVIVTADGGII